jgi:lipopolysaccharide biosynthesis glycosyltransferase
MMTGKHHLELLRMSVYSVAKNWESLPRLVVINDGTVSEEKIRAGLRFWKGELLIQPWELSSAYHAQKSRMALVKYAAAHIFGKKMSVILHHGEQSPVLWVDSDILFFKDPRRFIPVNADEFGCGGTEDWFRAYDDNILALLPDNDLMSRPGMNAGMLYLTGAEIYERFNFEQILANVCPDYHFFTEQTMFSYVAEKSFGILWNQQAVKNIADDRQLLKATIPDEMVARHYTSPMRALFWRDALFNL